MFVSNADRQHPTDPVSPVSFDFATVNVGDPTTSHLRNLKQALGSWRRALEGFESALLEFEETPVCEVCGEALTATRRDAKTCSAACRQKAYRLRAQHLSPKRRGKHSRAILDAPGASAAIRQDLSKGKEVRSNEAHHYDAHGSVGYGSNDGGPSLFLYSPNCVEGRFVDSAKLNFRFAAF